MGIRAAVDEDQLELGLVLCPAPLLMLPDPIRVAEVFALGDREGDLHRIDLGDVREHGRRGHEVADLDRRNAGDPRDRRVDLRPSHVEARVLDGRLGSLHLSLARLCRLDGVVEFLLGRRALCRERLVFLDIELILLEGGLLLREVAEGLVERRLVGTIVDLEEELVRSHVRAVLVVLLEQIPLHARHDLGVHEADRRSHPLAVDRHVLLDGGRHEDVGRRRRRGLGSLACGAEGDRERSEHRGTGKPPSPAQERNGMAHRDA